MGRRTVVEIVVALALFTVASFLLFHDLGASSLHDGDEALYAEVAREMLESRSLLTPLYWGAPFLHKPPLPYWLMAVSGESIRASQEFAARFTSALSGLLLLCLVYVTTRWLAGIATAAVATSVLAVNHQFLFEHVARSASFDALLALLMFSALVAGLKAADGVWWRLGAAALLGAVALVKAPMVIFPLAAVVHHWLRDRRFAIGFCAEALIGVAIVALPWHVYQAVIHGKEFWDTYIVYEIIGRAGATLRDPGAHVLIHLEAAWLSFLPWSPLLAIALVATIVGGPARTNNERDAFVRSLGLYAALIFVFFCFIPSKWPWYAVPAYPAIVVVAAVFIRRWYDSRWRHSLPFLLAGLVCVGVLLLDIDPAYTPASRPSFLWPSRTHFYVWHPHLESSFASFAILGIALVALICLLPAMQARRRFAVAGIAAAVALSLGFNLRSVLAVPQAHRSAIDRLAAELEERGIERVYVSGFRHESRYRGRQEPLSSYYMLGIRHAQVIDCGATFECISSSGEVSAALVVGNDALAQNHDLTRLAALTPGLEIWVLRPASSRGYEKLE